MLQLTLADDGVSTAAAALVSAFITPLDTGTWTVRAEWTDGAVEDLGRWPDKATAQGFLVEMVSMVAAFPGDLDEAPAPPARRRRCRPPLGWLAVAGLLVAVLAGCGALG